MTAPVGSRPAQEGAARLLDPVPLEVPKPLVLLRLGYRRPQQVPAKIAALLDEILAKVRLLAAPRAVWGAFPVEEKSPGEVVVGLDLVSASRSLRERLLGCPRAVLFAATIGPAAEAWLSELNASGEMTRSLIGDACASAAAIALGAELERIIGRFLAEEGLQATGRYAPGYGDFGLEAQAPLLRLVEASRIGIHLTDDFLMIPAKSITGVIGGRPRAAATDGPD